MTLRSNSIWTEMMITIHRAPADHHERLTEIAHAAKRYWRYPERYLELWKDELTITAQFIADHDVFEARRGTEAVGFLALTREGEKRSIEHCWVDPAAIGEGVGTLLFQRAVQHAREHGATILEVISDPNAEGFYRRMGGERIGHHVSELEGEPRHLPVLSFHLARLDV